MREEATNATKEGGERTQEKGKSSSSSRKDTTNKLKRQSAPSCRRVAKTNENVSVVL